MVAEDRGRGPRQEALTRQRVVAEAIELLDAEGEFALTFRALSTRLQTGIGTVQWHVGDKASLLLLITDELVAEQLANGASAGKARDAIRCVALSFFNLLEQHPWLGAQLVQRPWQPAVMRLYEHIGRQLSGLGVHDDDEFDVATAFLNYLLGLAGQYAAAARTVPQGSDRAEFLKSVQQEWRRMDPEQYPFVHKVAVQLPHHDDRQQFLAGVELLLAGAALSRTTPRTEVEHSENALSAAHQFEAQCSASRVKIASE